MAIAELTTPAPGSPAELWYSNGYLEVKILRRVSGLYELRNFRRLVHPKMEELFAAAELV